MTNIPNILTLLRFALIPFFCYFMITGHVVTAVIIYLAASFTDFLDGYIARKFGQITAFGKFMDPFADKLLQIAALVLITILPPRIPVAITIIIILKELLIGAGGLMLYKKYKVYAAADWYGKIATVIFYIAIVGAMLESNFSPGTHYGLAAILFALVLSLFAFVMYLIRYLKSVRKVNADKKEN
jgi:cardiolipin synthase